jgi:hypothetical protein
MKHLNSVSIKPAAAQLVDVAVRMTVDDPGQDVGEIAELRLCAVPYRCRAFFAVAALNETPNRIETLRIRSGLRFMIRAASSKDFDALAS